MSKTLLLVCSCLVSAVAAMAEPPPDGPSVAPMPNPGHWIRKAPGAEARGSGTATGTKAVEASVETWLVGNSRFDLVTLSDGTHRDCFLANGVCYQSDGSKSGFYIVDPKMDTGAGRLPSVKEWQELAWVKPEFFKERGSAEGYECYIYEESSAAGVRRAMIEVKTRLPIVFEDKGRKYVYKYLTPSNDLPKPDAALSSVVDSYQRKLKSITVDRKPR